MKKQRTETLALDRIVGGGQALGTLESGKKVFVWGGLPGETVHVQITKQKSSMAEGIVTDVLRPAPERIEPRDPESYLSTSPWQIMKFEAEQQYKAQLIKDAFELHKVTLPQRVEVFTDGQQYNYRNKVEFSWWWDNDTNQLDLAFFRRGTTGKVPVPGTSLVREEIQKLAVAIRDLLRSKDAQARSLKTLLIRVNRDGACVWQLYVKDEIPELITPDEAAALPAQGGEIIYSDPRSPASRITKRLVQFGDVVLHDHIRSIPFHYATEGFFQVNIPVYERALEDMQQWVEAGKPTVDMYSGVGSIGLTIGGPDVTLVEVDEHAFREMERNITAQKRQASVHAVLAPSEKALEHINANATLIVDPPRAGLHQAVIDRILEALPSRIIYLSCNPVTQARDVSLLLSAYKISAHSGYNFFPRTPHIENLVVLERA
jgi:23S rRNA (uracil1939-C5)-methyltransferase